MESLGPDTSDRTVLDHRPVKDAARWRRRTKPVCRSVCFLFVFLFLAFALSCPSLRTLILAPWTPRRLLHSGSTIQKKKKREKEKGRRRDRQRERKRKRATPVGVARSCQCTIVARGRRRSSLAQPDLQTESQCPPWIV